MKTKLILISIGILLIVIATLSLNSKIKRLRELSQLQAVELAQYKDSTKQLKTKNGELYAKFVAISVDKSNLKEALEIAGVDKKELKERGVKLSNLVAYYKLQLETHGQGETNGRDTIYLAGKDTIWGKKFDDWTDKYLTLTKLRTDQKKLFFEYGYQTSIESTQEPTKNGAVITVWLSDPKAKITTGAQINVKVKKYWYQKPWIWGVGGLVGGYYLSTKL